MSKQRRFYALSRCCILSFIYIHLLPSSLCKGKSSSRLGSEGIAAAIVTLREVIVVIFTLSYKSLCVVGTRCMLEPMLQGIISLGPVV